MIDLHIHTTYSDGQYAPAETLQLAKQSGVTVAAITDHDTVSGLGEAETAAQELGLQFFPGIEISVQNRTELHILGYGIDRTNQPLHRFCQNHAKERQERSTRLLAYLEKCGAPVTLEEVRQYNHGKTSGRPHFARALVEKGYASSIQDAFDRYLTTPEFYAHVERPKPTPEEGMRVIHAAGGVAVLAHPHQLKLEEKALDTLVQQLKKIGLQGIEAYYSRHTPEQTAFYLKLAQKHHLLYTCGSDFHGPLMKPEIAMGTGICGNLCVDDRIIPERLFAAIAAVQKMLKLLTFHLIRIIINKDFDEWRQHDGISW